MMITNQEFLHAIFGEHFIWAHVTDFFHDPSADFSLESKMAWKGDYFINTELRNYSNQYFCISLFKELPDQPPRRRKELFDAAYCFVIDDVGEKISVDRIIALPAPSWFLSTSPGSQQWGYILSEPCHNRETVEKLLKGIVKKLCIDGVDPGMLGVTRYVRLPEGYNTKASKIKLNGGKPYKCELILWEPTNRGTISQNIEGFDIDLNKVIVSKSYNDCHDYDYDENFFVNHPLWDVIDFKEVVEFNKFYIECPWKHEHTSQVDSGSMVFISSDGRIGFKCHHGHCVDKTGQDFVTSISESYPNWQDKYNEYCKILRKNQVVIPCPITFNKKKE